MANNEVPEDLGASLLLKPCLGILITMVDFVIIENLQCTVSGNTCYASLSYSSMTLAVLKACVAWCTSQQDV